MSVAVVWLDSEQAKLFRFSDDQMERKVLKVLEGGLQQMHDSICEWLKSEKKILVLGSDVSWDPFLKRLQERYPEASKRVVGCENTDQATDPQIAAYAMRYFGKPVARVLL